MAADEPESGVGTARALKDAATEETDALTQARPASGDAVADVMRANLRRSLLGVDAPAPKRGRFTILERIGGGAMGTVLSAYDPVLDRKVALKVLRERGQTARTRVLAEARALAKLSDPHVVAVHEADEHGDEVYIAMEFVEGVDLRTWLDERPRTWTEVLPVLTDAARGLAAAHSADVIHCDFKPGNVLVSGDGAKVVDFGLAHRRDDAEQGADASSGGTPSYMAPERLAGEPASVASDQYAFGVTLFEALRGRRPDEPESESTSPCPRWLEGLVTRMLSADPRERLPSMDAVVVELSRPRGSRRTLAVAGLVVAVAAMTGWVAYQRGAGQDPCAGGLAAMEEVWNDQRAVAVEDALRSSGAPFAESTNARVTEQLGQYQQQWVATHREICEATRVRGSQSDTIYDRRMRCLQRGLGQVSAVLDAIVDADAKGSARAIEAIVALPSPAECDERSATAARVAVPDDPERRRSVAAARQTLDQAWAVFATGRYREARALSEPLVREAERLEFEPLRAEVLHLHGAVIGRVGAPKQAEQVLRDAMLAASEAGDDRLTAKVSIRLLRTMMFGREPERVYDVADFVRASIERAGEDVHEVDGIVGEARLGAGDASAAIEGLTRALSSERREDRAAILKTTLGSAYLAAGQQDQALRLYSEALDQAQRFYGQGHPSVGFFLQRLGRGQREAGQLNAALKTLDRTLALRQAALGHEDRAVASTLLDLGMTHAKRGDTDTAIEQFTAALRIREAVYGAQHARLAEVLLPLGNALRHAGRRNEALSRYRAAVEIRENATPDHPQLEVLRDHIADLSASIPAPTPVPRPAD